jgi:glycosyltransferase involved in cell wall biosynthesis
MRILITSNTTWNIVNFRMGLVRALLASGHEVLCASPPDGYETTLQKLPIKFIPIHIDAKGTNPFHDIKLLYRYARLFYEENIDVVITYTIKPTIYAGIAAQLTGTRKIHVITGLGTAFLRKGWLQWGVTQLYRIALRRSVRVFFQNSDDRALFLENTIVPAASTEIMPGSGVDTSHFSIAPMPDAPPVRFLLIARMLWDKGIGEFIAALRQLRAEGWPVEGTLLGFVGVDNPSAIPEATIRQWEAEGIVRYGGATTDVRPCIAKAHCVVLPSSYREGVPRSLLEAAAMGRPIITTDAPGCRDTVDPQVSGFLVPPKDALALAQAMRAFLRLAPEERSRMGLAGRAKIVAQFDEGMVIATYMRILAEMNPSCPR